MSWFLAGCYGLALINLSVALQLTQMPRYYGMKTGRTIKIQCLSMKGQLNGNVTWYKDQKDEELRGERIIFSHTNTTQRAYVYIHKLHVEDGGLYFCKCDNVWGPGTQIHVLRHINRETAEYRSSMKDGLIVLQGLVLAVCIAAVMLRKQKLLERRDSIYEEPETDHIYEGLAIETCGGGLYEELSVYTQAEVAEAPWE